MVQSYISYTLSQTAVRIMENGNMIRNTELFKFKIYYKINCDIVQFDTVVY